MNVRFACENVLRASKPLHSGKRHLTTVLNVSCHFVSPQSGQTKLVVNREGGEYAVFT